MIPAVAARYGGPSRAIFEMCRALRAQGVETFIATTDADGGGSLPVVLGERVDYQGVPAIFFPRQWSEAFKYSRPLANWLNAHVPEFDAVHIHAVFSHACLAASIACRRADVPYIVRPLGTLAPWSLSQKPIRKRVMWSAALRGMMTNAAAIHYTTVEEKAQVEAWAGLERGVVIPVPLDFNILEAQAPLRFREHQGDIGEHPYVLALSRLHPVKGLENLLRAFAEVVRKPELMDWRLILAGEGTPSYEASLKRIARDRGVEVNVIFTGWLDTEAKVSALTQAALLASPSHHESFGVSVAEALACGVPVLITPEVNLASEIERAQAGWVAELDDLALVGALEVALQNGDERARRGANGRRLARRFGPSQISQQLLQLYQDVTKVAQTLVCDSVRPDGQGPHRLKSLMQPPSG